MAAQESRARGPTHGVRLSLYLATALNKSVATATPFCHNLLRVNATRQEDDTMKTTSYTGDDGIERCLDCDGFLAEPGAKCKRCSNRVKAVKEADKAATKAAAALETKTAADNAIADQGKRWRRNTLRQYTARLLATKSGSVERQRYFEEHPISDIFKPVR